MSESMRSTDAHDADTGVHDADTGTRAKSTRSKDTRSKSTCTAHTAHIARIAHITRARLAISPSILSADFMNLERDVRHIVEGGADMIHFDVMDGHFVPNLTLGIPFVKSMKKICDAPLDVHLMVANPKEQVKWFIDAGADMLTFHIEATEDPIPIIEEIHSAGRVAGISLNPDTPVSAIDGLSSYVDLILVMSVYPGFAGQSYIEGSQDKLRALSGCKALISIDGGINLQTARLAVLAGADILVAGNSIFGAKDPILAMDALRKVALEARESFNANEDI